MNVKNNNFLLFNDEIILYNISEIIYLEEVIFANKTQDQKLMFLLRHLLIDFELSIHSNHHREENKLIYYLKVKRILIRFQKLF